MQQICRRNDPQTHQRVVGGRPMHELCHCGVQAERCCRPIIMYIFLLHLFLQTNVDNFHAKKKIEI